MPNCLVCDEKNSARHYGSICCSGCKGFFRRSVRYKRSYVCAYNKDCTIKREYRNCCRACRYQKCIDIGLDPMMVHSDRSCDGGPSTSAENGDFNEPELPISTTIDIKPIIQQKLPESISIVHNRNVKFSEEELRNEHNQNLANAMRSYLLHADNGPLGTKNIINPFKKHDFTSVTRFYLLVGRLLEDFREHDYSHLIATTPLHNFNLNVSLEKAFLSEPRLVSDRSHIDWQPKLMIRPAWYSRCWARILVYYVDWISHVPELAELEEQERIHLTIGRLAPCVWNIIANRTVAYHQDGQKRILLSGGIYYPLDDNEQNCIDPNLSKFLTETCKWVYTEVVEPAIQMDVSEEEFALLCVICFLTPVPLLSRKSKSIIRNAQNYYRSVLTDLVVNCSTTTDFMILSKRLSSILMLLTPLEKTAQIEDENMAVMSVFDINGMTGSLPYEFFVRRTMRF